MENVAWFAWNPQNNMHKIETERKRDEGWGEREHLHTA